MVATVDPVSMGWTRNIPSIVGYYWAYDPIRHHQPLLVLVDYYGHVRGWFVQWPSGVRKELREDSEDVLWWYGPIERPHFPGADNDHA